MKPTPLPRLRQSRLLFTSNETGKDVALAVVIGVLLALGAFHWLAV